MTGSSITPHTSFEHPLVDAVGDGFVASYASAPIVALTEGRTGLLIDAARGGRKVILVTPASSRLTIAMLQMLQLSGGEWVVQLADGSLRTGTTGRILTELEGAFDAGLEIDLDFLKPDETSVPWLQFSVSVEHPPTALTRLGSTVELLAGKPAGWGVNEPTGLHWNPDNVTRFVRGRMPSQTRVFANGPLMSASIRVSRSQRGVFEESKIFVTPIDDSELVERVTTLFERLALAERVRFGMAYSQRGRADLTVASGVASPLNPLAAVLGPRAVRDAQVPLDELAAAFSARSVGSSRIQSLVVPLTGWDAFQRASRLVGLDNIARAMGERPDA